MRIALASNSRYPPEALVVGERVQFDWYAGEPEAENEVAKNKLTTMGRLSGGRTKGTASAFVCKAVNGTANAHAS
jgi:hypothetical protein